MDRRTFIITASAAAAASCVGSVCALAKPAPLARRAERLVLACPAPESTGGLFDDARLLARALEGALQEHSAAPQVKIEVIPGPAASIAAIADGHADFFYGPEHANSSHVPALGFVAGMPGHLPLKFGDVGGEPRGGRAVVVHALPVLVVEGHRQFADLQAVVSRPRLGQLLGQGGHYA